MRLLLLPLAAGLVSCGDPPPASAPAAPEAAEDAWPAALSAKVEIYPPETACGDNDGDGFVNAVQCPGASPALLDCDDTDPAVTPETERWVRPGPFLMGAAAADPDEGPVHVVQLSGFCLDRTEVTAGAFASWRRKRGKAAEIPADRQNYPAVGVGWSDAQAYCRARGKELPTEAQWEKAARGGCELGDQPDACDPADVRSYPWGEQAPTCERANYAPSTREPCSGEPLAVASLPSGAGPYGHHDLAGNAWEYTADAYNPAAYAADRQRRDPIVAAGDWRVLRGGAWDSGPARLRVTDRFPDSVAGTTVGFRCARPDVNPTKEALPPLRLVALRGTLSRAQVEGEPAAKLGTEPITITAYGASPDEPLAAIRVAPGNRASQDFTLRVPPGGPYHLVATAAGAEAQSDPLQAERDLAGISLVIP